MSPTSVGMVPVRWLPQTSNKLFIRVILPISVGSVPVSALEANVQAAILVSLPNSVWWRAGEERE